MFYLLGALCIAWTAYELAGLVQTRPRPAAAQPLRRATDHFQAWDQDGERLEVEQVRGQRKHPRRRASDLQG